MVNSGISAAASISTFAVVGFEDLREAHVHLADDGLRGDAVLFVVGSLVFAAAVGFVDGAAHGVGHLVGVEDGAAFEVAGGAADGLDEGALERRKPSLSASRMATSETSGRSRPSRRRLMPMRTSYSPLRRSREELDALEGFDLGVHVAAADADLGVVVGEVFGHALGEGGDEDALVALGAVADFGEQVVDLAFDGADFDLRVDEAGGADDLFDDDAGGRVSS